MPILIKMNLGCNFECDYCYQGPIKKFKELGWDVDKVEASIRKLVASMPKGSCPQIILHGGEPLTLPIKVFEKMLALSFELTGRSSIQTNGYLINGRIIELFKKYKTGVGISIDGPFPCNIPRGKGTPKEREEQTNKILKNIDLLLKEGISTSIIAVIHKKNALGTERELLKNFVLQIHEKRMSGRLNPCGSDNPEIGLTITEAIDFYTDMYKFMEQHGIYGWTPFVDILNSLQKKPCVCTFSGCDPYSTNSATSVLHDGSLGVCLRLYEDGKMYLRDDKTTGIRTELLRETECKDCRWFEYCRGGCSGLSKDFDWRHKDRFCELYKVLFELASNTIKFVGADQKTNQPQGHRPSGGGGEHNDGGVIHLDSGKDGGDHTDGINHTDNGTEHVDSDMKSNEQRSSGNNDHWDGERHVDGETEHLDSDAKR